MILSALLCVAAPLSFAPQHVGQDYVLRQHQDFSSDVITLKEGADANTPLGFATLAMTLGMDADTDSDLLVMRLDQDYNVIWKRQIGGPQNEYSRNLVQTQDGGILVSAFSHSTPVISQRAVLVKFDALGNLMWERCYPGEDIPGVEAGVAVTELDNGNLLMVSNVRGEMDGSLDAVVILTDPNGIPISIWRHGTFENLPVRLIYKSLDSRGQEAVA